MDTTEGAATTRGTAAGAASACCAVGAAGATGVTALAGGTTGAAAATGGATAGTASTAAPVAPAAPPASAVPPAPAAGAARAALLVLADGRFPAGGHAHSGGAEAAVRAGRITDAETLLGYCRGRLHTTGLTSAALAAAAAAGIDPLALDEAADARTPSPALRVTARRLGRQLLRAARAAWPDPELDALAAARPRGAHQPVVLGLTCRVAGLAPLDAAYAAAHETVGGPAGATVRLLSLDPFDATAVLARLAPELDTVARSAAGAARRAVHEGPGTLPAASGPLPDIAAERHAVRSVRLFAS